MLQPLQLTAIAAPSIDRTDPNGNVYLSPRNDFAEAYVQNKYTTFYNDFGTTVSEVSFAQYFGVAMSGFDAAAVANSGSHPVPVGVAIEGQPVANIPGVASRFEYLNTHSLTLIADSLRLQILFKEIDPNLSMDDIQTIFQASSASSANILLGRAEKDTLENALDVIRKALLPIDPSFQPTPSSEAASGFGLISNRTVFHTNIATVEHVLSQAVPGTYRIESLVNRPLEEVTGDALLEDAEGKGLAYRYAFKELNPFAIIGPAYSQHNPNGELALFNLETGTGSITIDYIQDRGLFLAEKIALNQGNRDIPLNPFTLTHYHDNTTGYDIPPGLSIPPQTERKYIFGSESAETIVGGSLISNDHLYGGGGNDLLEGGDGRDYLQGDAGIDRLDGGGGADTMVGGADNDFYIVDHLGDEVIEGLNNGTDRVESSASFTLGANVEHLTLTGTSDLNGTGNELNNTITGNSGINRLDGKGGTDHLIGEIRNDILVGGTGDNDLLEGGAGFDTYYLQRRGRHRSDRGFRCHGQDRLQWRTAPRRDQYRWRRHLCQPGWHRNLCPLRRPSDREWGAHRQCRFRERAVRDQLSDCELPRRSCRSKGRWSGSGQGRPETMTCLRCRSGGTTSSAQASGTITWMDGSAMTSYLVGRLRLSPRRARA